MKLTFKSNSVNLASYMPAGLQTQSQQQTFQTHMQHQQQPKPFDMLNDASLYIIQEGKAGTSVVSGLCASLHYFLKRLNTIKDYEKPRIERKPFQMVNGEIDIEEAAKSVHKVIEPEFKGKELIKQLRKQGIIRSLPVTIIAPFIAVGGLVGAVLLYLNSFFPKNENDQQ